MACKNLNQKVVIFGIFLRFSHKLIQHCRKVIRCRIKALTCWDETIVQQFQQLLAVPLRVAKERSFDCWRQIIWNIFLRFCQPLFALSIILDIRVVFDMVISLPFNRNLLYGLVKELFRNKKFGIFRFDSKHFDRKVQESRDVIGACRQILLRFANFYGLGNLSFKFFGAALNFIIHLSWPLF